MPTPKSPSSRTPQLPLLLGAGTLITLGLLRRSKAGAALAVGGAALAWKGLQDTTPPSFTARARFRVGASVDDAYKTWRDTPGLVRFMASIKSIEAIDSDRSRWTMLGAGDVPVSWTSELTEDQPGKRIAWRSTADSPIQTSGFVEFSEDPLGRGIFVTTESTFNVPSNAAARAIYSILGKNPTFIARENVRKFKSFLEAGEIPTVEGQSHGPRGLKGQLERGVYRETSNPAGPQVNAPRGAADSRELQHA